MTVKKLFLITFFLLNFLSCLTWTLTINSFEIRDLQSTSSFFQTESQSWQATQALASVIATQCAGVWILGGYGVIGNGGTFTRTYSSLPAHNIIYFTMDVWILDLNESIDLFKIYFDGTLVQDWNSYGYYPGSFPASNLCGGAKNDFKSIYIGAKVVHTSSQLTITVAPMFNRPTDTFSIGFRNLSLLFQTALDDVSFACEFSISYGSGSSCLCQKGTFSSASAGSCAACNSLCQTCLGSSQSNCTSCKPGYSYNGQTCFKCHSTCQQCNGTAATDCITCAVGNFLYWNGTCQTSCSSPLISRSVGDDLFCDLPCGTTRYLYQNNTCLSDCAAPFVQITQGDLKYCNFPCLNSGFLYWNGSCLPTCPVSFQQQTGIEKYCKFYCTGNNYQYQNGSCLPICNRPLIQRINSESYKFCDLPCNPGEFLFPDGTCQSNCNFQVSTSGEGINFCNYPCVAGSYLYENNTCIGICNFPYVSIVLGQNLILCKSPCTKNEFYFPQTGSCIGVCNSPSIIIQDGVLSYCLDQNQTSQFFKDRAYFTGQILDSISQGTAIAGSFFRPNDRGSAFTTSLVKLVKYIKYIKAPIHEEIREILDSNISSIFSISTTFCYSLPENLKEEFPKHSLPSVFSTTLDHSSYLINHWDSMSSYIILFAMGLGCFLLEKLIQKFEKKRVIKLIIKRFRITTKWNFLLCIIFNTYDDLTLFAILEFKSVQFDSFTSTISFIVCIFVTFLATYLLFKVFKINREAIKIKNQIIDAKAKNQEFCFYEKWEDFQVLFSGYKNESIIKQEYLFWFTCRIIITYLIVGLLVNHPLIQTIQFTLLSVIMLVYLIKLRPIKDTFSYFVSLIFELLIISANVCLTSLVIIDATNNLTMELQYNLSLAILIVNIMIDICGNVVMWLYVLLTMRAAYLASKEYGLSGKTSWLTVFVVVYQNPGMDFNDFSNQEFFRSHTDKTYKFRKQIPNKKQNFPQVNVDILRQIKPDSGESDSQMLTLDKYKKNKSQFLEINDKNIKDKSEINELRKLDPKNIRASNFRGSKNESDYEIDSQSVTSLKSWGSPINNSVFQALEAQPFMNKRESNSSILALKINESNIDEGSSNQKRISRLNTQAMESDREISSAIMPKKKSLEQRASLTPLSLNKYLNYIESLRQNRITEDLEEIQLSGQFEEYNTAKRQSKEVEDFSASSNIQKFVSENAKKRNTKVKADAQKINAESNQDDQTLNIIIFSPQNRFVKHRTIPRKSNSESIYKNSESFKNLINGICLEAPIENNLKQEKPNGNESQNQSSEEKKSLKTAISGLFFNQTKEKQYQNENLDQSKEA